jgi:hypothetical protein
MRDPKSSNREAELPAIPRIGSGDLLGVADLQLVLGALDSLGVALADHRHQWTVGERVIYEEAVSLLTLRVGCMDSGLAGSKTRSSLMPCSELRRESCRASVRSLASEYSLWRVVLAAGHLAMTKLFQCFVWIYSYMQNSIKSKRAATPNVES